MSFGKRLKKLRKEKGLTLREMSNKFNRGRTSFSNYENDYRKPDMDLIKELADFFEVSVDYLLGRTDVKNPEQEVRIPKEIKKHLSPEEQEFLLELLPKKDFHAFLREAREASNKDLATAVRVFKAVKEGDTESNSLSNLE
ncbi:helix-turn-helix domain-containing protein [Fuchsiella alkaliacetigena]|uniref:helix-turn-helix domain-containing protein n=1 Tax=Fuchsiella alkaliacetigena TaxID=957042 RepID=UPI00200B4A85|nr:helix-turn-helix transcriptional regulator [Fuchsiella alkaliacetigena]MCK8825544.1 helix-turn-helix transcriptional regulator [Fuchsiella alkaliacetigena]